MNDFDTPTIISTPPTRTVSATMTEPPLGADNYQIGHEIARGGMGSIFEAEDSKLKRTVAVKVMLLDASADISSRQRFLREAEVLAMLAHPNIVSIYDIVWEDGLPLFYSMKMVKGRTLQSILTALRHHEPKALQDYTLDRLLIIFRKVCDASGTANQLQRKRQGNSKGLCAGGKADQDAATSDEWASAACSIRRGDESAAAGQGSTLSNRRRSERRHRSVSGRLCHKCGTSRDSEATQATHAATQGRDCLARGAAARECGLCFQSAGE